ncbi:hypothetical protein A0H81_10403 [Grifola frondosa]|uniref:Uncharacterized protein n=1 Tax=Grifola frondosa TaxID=5627 RepID=A0A1C7LZ13_GRIFR|nr:hypothetical protein A0H81_10403 [Grifola frondosa]
MLKIIFRVERGDDYALDPHTGKRKLFDIVVQTPVHILSHLCNPNTSRSPHILDPSMALLLVRQTQVVATGRLDRMSSLLSAESASSAEHSPTASVFTSPLSRQDSLLDRTELFERLIAGQESEVGEAPPSYNAVVEARPAPTNALH